MAQNDDITKLREEIDALLKLGQRAHALPKLERLMTMVPNDLTLRQTVADLNAQFGRKAKAVAHYARACADYALLGRSMQAIALCRRILEIDPTHAETQARLAELYAGRPGPVDVLGEEPTVQPNLQPMALLELNQFRPTPPPPPSDAFVEEETLAVEPTPIPSPPPFELPRIPLFSALSPREFIAVLEGAVEAKAYDPGELIVAEGEADHAMFAIVQGRVVVERELTDGAKAIDQMGEGDVFGEVALLASARRTASVRATAPTVVLRFEREAMIAVMNRSPSIAKTVDEFCRARLLANWMRASALFRPLNLAERAELRKRFEPVVAAKDQVLVQAGQQGDEVYLVLRGRCSVVGVHGEEYPDLVEGQSFGEISVIRDIPATATVRAVTECLLLRLPRAGALTSVLQHPAVRPIVDRVIAERLQRTEQLVGIVVPGSRLEG